MKLQKFFFIVSFMKQRSCLCRAALLKIFLNDNTIILNTQYIAWIFKLIYIMQVYYFIVFYCNTRWIDSHAQLNQYIIILSSSSNANNGILCNIFYTNNIFTQTILFFSLCP